MPVDGQADNAAKVAGLVSDPEPLVRLAALLALAGAPESAEAAGAIVGALVDGKVDGDKWLPDAATAAAAAHARPFLKAVASRKNGKPAAPIVVAIAGRVAEHYARGVAPAPRSTSLPA